MSGVCIRIDKHDGYATKIKNLIINPEYTQVLAARHVGDKNENPHFHIVIKTQIKLKTLRARMVIIFDKGKGNIHLVYD